MHQPRLASRLRSNLPEFSIATVKELGWAGLRDHVLIPKIEGRFDVFPTIDKGFEFEHDLRKLSFGIIILTTTNNQMPSWERLAGKRQSGRQRQQNGQNNFSVSHMGSMPRG